MNNFFDYLIRIADNSLILGHRLSEWCGHGPVLEQDMAMTNIALDLIGQARSLYALAADVQNEGKTEDDIAYLRDVLDYKNILLVEQPNGDFAHTIVRQFFFSAFQLPFYKQLYAFLNPEEDTIQYIQKNNYLLAKRLDILRGIIEKAIKEVTYHLRWSSEWMIRLGDGTEESHDRMQTAVNDLFMYSGEAFVVDSVDREALAAGYGVNLDRIKPIFDATINAVLAEATLQKPKNEFMQKGGKEGIHSEYLGYLLAEMQYLQRAYPNSVW
jgi:ring-1,2-phenylacetyl-CoA epoxidase subunit PaaC